MFCSKSKFFIFLSPRRLYQQTEAWFTCFNNLVLDQFIVRIFFSLGVLFFLLDTVVLGRLCVAHGFIVVLESWLDASLLVLRQVVIDIVWRLTAADMIKNRMLNVFVVRRYARKGRYINLFSLEFNLKRIFERIFFFLD